MTYYIVYTEPKKGAKRHIYLHYGWSDFWEAVEERDIMATFHPYLIWEIYSGNWIKVVDKRGRVLKN